MGSTASVPLLVRAAALEDPSIEALVGSLRETFLLLKRRQMGSLGARNLSWTELTALDLCARASTRTVGELAGDLGLTAAGMTALIDRLEERGWVERRRDGRDRRAVLVHATPKGRQVRLEARKAVYDTLRGVARRMEESDRRALATGLAALHRSLLVADPGA